MHIQNIMGVYPPMHVKIRIDVAIFLRGRLGTVPWQWIRNQTTSLSIRSVADHDAGVFPLTKTGRFALELDVMSAQVNSRKPSLPTPRILKAIEESDRKAKRVQSQ
ncbi:hypothetical protein ACLOJK_013558 [Asimina triloba]